jgi:hypothetical protein
LHNANMRPKKACCTATSSRSEPEKASALENKLTKNVSPSQQRDATVLLTAVKNLSAKMTAVTSESAKAPPDQASTTKEASNGTKPDSKQSPETCTLPLARTSKMSSRADDSSCVTKNKKISEHQHFFKKIQPEMHLLLEHRSKNPRKQFVRQ